LGSFPLIFRELRVLARQGQLFWIRVTGAAAGFATLAFLLLSPVVVGAHLGRQIFQALNSILFFTIVFVGPVVTCDCIAQEKREGTLGLLFLAPISSRSIVLSKLAINAIRAVTLFLAVLPMMALPIVFGGIPLKDILWVVLLQTTALCIALSSGILSSTLYRNFIQTAVVAELFCAGFFILFRFFIPLTPFVACVAGLMGTITVMEFCSNALKAKWEQESSNYKEPFWVRAVAASSTGQMMFWQDTRAARSRNPIAWLQEYSWSARLAKWGWLSLALSVELFEMFDWGDLSTHSREIMIQRSLAVVLVLGMSLAGANSFRRERLSGAMELLLVTPLSPRQIILGRLWGIWVHFFPAILTVSVVWITASRYFLYAGVHGDLNLLLSSYVVVPMVGLLVSLLPWHLLVAWQMIFLIGAVLPISLPRLLIKAEFDAAFAGVLLQTGVGAISFYLLQRKLKDRSFVVS
jgi:ABC-type transport system involved in multi-copper enzyme maturation permease subunit